MFLKVITLYLSINKRKRDRVTWARRIMKAHGQWEEPTVASE